VIVRLYYLDPAEYLGAERFTTGTKGFGLGAKGGPSKSELKIAAVMVALSKINALRALIRAEAGILLH